MAIQINYNEIDKFLHLKDIFVEILEWTIKKLNLPVSNLDVIFSGDAYVKKLHKDFFNLNTKTDVITFDLSDNPDEIEGEIYISIDRALEQSQQYEVSPEQEVCRLMIHGCLHLAGYNDIEKNDLNELKRIENKLVEEVNRTFHKKLYVVVN